MGASSQGDIADGFVPNTTVGVQLLHRNASNGNAPDFSERRRLVNELEERLRFETLLSDLSARFINLPADDVDKEVEAMQGRIVQFLGLDRSTLFQLSEDESTLVVTHCWAAPGFVSLKGLIPRDKAPWGLGKALGGETIVFSSLEDLPEEAATDKATMRQVGPKANVTFPLTAGGGAVFGALAFGKITEERAWPETVVQRLRLVAQLFANALMRKRSEQKLRHALAEIKQLKERLHQENVYLRQEASLLHGHENVIGQSPALKKALAQVEQVAGAEATVLLLGETGTGKELMATAIHNLSSRRGRAMVKVNCAALPATLVESELFGREKGAYTGALSKQIGRFELAHNSTIFLDEVGDLPADVQVKLLRVLQEGHAGAPRQPQTDPRQRARHRGHQPGPHPPGAGGAVPRGPLLPPERLSDHRASPARAAAGHRPAGLGLRGGVLQGAGQDYPGHRQGEHGDSEAPPVARQCPRVEERYRAGHDNQHGHDPSRDDAGRLRIDSGQKHGDGRCRKGAYPALP